MGRISFDDKAPHSKGSRIFHRLIPDTEVYIRQLSRIVLHTLYESPEECIVPVHHLRFMLEDTDGVACKWGGNGEVAIPAARAILRVCLKMMMRRRFILKFEESCCMS